MQNAPKMRTSLSRHVQSGGRREASSGASGAGGAGGAGGDVPIGYNAFAKWAHWLMAGTAGAGCVGTIMVRRYFLDKDSPKHAFYMRIHKTCGVLTFLALGPRVVNKLITRSPPKLPGSPEAVLAGDLSHKLLYGLITALGFTGMGMALFSGKPLPFFGWDINVWKNSFIAGNSYWLHGKAGTVLEYTLPLHVGASFYHAARGEAIFRRINPFIKTKPI